MKRTLSLSALLALCLAVVPSLRVCRAQTTPFLSDEEIRMLSNEISGDRAFEHIRWLSHWHRDSGMEGFFKARDYVMQAAKDGGLDEVRFVEQTLDGAPNYTARSGELWMTEPVALKLADMEEAAVYLADGSHSADVTAELIFIGDATEDEVKNLDVKGKIVLTSASPQRAVVNAVEKRGAVGVVTYQTSENRSAFDVPDQIAWQRISPAPFADGRETFAFSIPPRKGDTLRRILATNDTQDFFATGKPAKGGRVVVRAKVVTEVGQVPGHTGFVEAVIRGTKPDTQQIVLTAHLQEEKSSANDDGSGCANLLELARAFNKLIKEGKMKRPQRDLRFWWTDEIASEYQLFTKHPEEVKKILANVHQDMTGANQAMGSRVQHLIFAPHSRTSYLDAVFESVGTYMIHTNNPYLAASRQGGLPRPFTRPLYSTRGTRQGYNARFVPYFDSSDHLVFLEGAIGIPAVGLINWDDPYIHSSDDDLYQIDQTQLRRNNFLIGSIAYFLANADDTRVPMLVAEVYAQGKKRLANDLQVAFGVLRDSASEPDHGWKRASAIVEQGLLREHRALESIRSFVGSNQDAARFVSESVRAAEGECTMAELVVFYRRLYHGELPRVALTAAEFAASKKIPSNVASLDEYFTNRNKVPFAAGGHLHGLMRAEVWNFVDGRRSYYDIYKAVYAEAAAGGSWYYGTVTLGDVTSLLDAAVEAKAVTLK
ncbi:MAG TPA: M28 family peptidase [Pyrinomonadaceae bacterium]|nr:M28 family peptidase [Pyrinomonadaceae bacterium]